MPSLNGTLGSGILDLFLSWLLANNRALREIPLFDGFVRLIVRWSKYEQKESA